MKRAKKRKPDFRRIRPTKTYSPQEIATSLDRAVATVHKWIRDGLPVLEGGGQKLILGSELKIWLMEKWDSKRQKNKTNEMRCFKCQKPSVPEIGSVQILPRNEKTVNIKAKCGLCGTEMHKIGSCAKIAEIRKTYRPFLHHTQRLVGYSNPSDKHTFLQDNRAAENTHPDTSAKSLENAPDRYCQQNDERTPRLAKLN